MTLINAAKPFLILFMGLLVFGACDRSQNTEDSTAPKHLATIPSKQPVYGLIKMSWQLRRHAELHEIADGGDIDLVFLGDSITQRWEEAVGRSGTEYYSSARPPILE